MKKKNIIILLLILILSLSLNAYADELSDAIIRRDKGELKDLLGGFFSGPEADVNAKKYGYGDSTPLMLAAYYERPEMAEILIDKDAKVDMQDDFGYTALMYAAERGNIKTLKVLIDAGADINAKNYNDMSATLIAINLNHEKIASYLIEEGADLKKYGYTMALKAVENNSLKIIKTLIDSGFEFESSENGGLALISAIDKNNIEITKHLFEAEADPNYLTEQNITPFLLSIQKGNLKMIELLIDNGANLNDKFFKGITPLMIAVQYHHPKVAKLLIDEGADVEAKLVDGGTNTLNEGVNALMLAAKEDQLEIVKELTGGFIFGPKADINAKDSLNYTPLMYAVKSNNIKVAEHLIDQGAEVNAVNEHGFTPLVLAIRDENLEITKLLISQGANIDFTNKYGNKPLMYAKNTYNDEIIKLIKNN